MQKLPPIAEPKDYGSAGIDGDSVNMGMLQRIMFLLSFGAITGNSILTFYAGATKGTKTTALAFNYRLASADYKVALSDGLGSEIAVAAAGLTLTATTFDHRQVVIDFENIDMPDGLPWLTMSIDATASVLLLNVSANGSPLYGGKDAPSVL
jgi:hypothetical protein